MKAFNDLADFSVEGVQELLTLAKRLETRPEPEALRGKVLSLLFLSPSLRTLASFQAAMTRLGGGAFVISPDMSIHGLETRPGIVMDGDAAEHIREAVPVIASYGDAIGIRAFAERKSIANDIAENEFRSLTALIDTPYINMESAMNHPCQSLADWKTLDDLGIPANGGEFVLSWAYHPKALPLAVPAATVHMAAMRGMRVTVLRPDEFALPAPVIAKAQRAAAVSGGSIIETNNRERAMDGAHVLYAESWIAPQFYHDPEREKTLRERYADWCVDELWFRNAQETAAFFHTLPVRRGVGVVDDVLDGPRSKVIHQSRNRMLVQMAILHRMLADG